MNYVNDEDTLSELFKQEYRQVCPPPGEKELIKANILASIDNTVFMNNNLLARPRIVVPMLAIISACLIAYGFWLSTMFS